MASSLSSLVGNLTEGFHKTKCKDCDYFLEYGSAKNNLIKYKWTPCNKDYSNKIDEELKKQFKNTFKFSNNDINKFIVVKKRCLSLWVYGWMGRFNETSLPEKEEFYSNLDMEDITDVDYMHAKRVCKDWNKEFRWISWFLS